MKENKVASIAELLEKDLQKTKKYIVTIDDLESAKEHFRLLMIKLRKLNQLRQWEVRDILIEKGFKKKDWHKQSISNMEGNRAPISIKFILQYISALGYSIKFLITENHSNLCN